METIKLSELSSYIDQQDITAVEGKVVHLSEVKDNGNWKLQGAVISDGTAEHDVAFWNGAIVSNLKEGDSVKITSHVNKETKKLEGLFYKVKNEKGNEYRTIQVKPPAWINHIEGPVVVEAEYNDYAEDRVERWFDVFEIVGREMDVRDIMLDYSEMITITNHIVNTFKGKYGVYAPVEFRDGPTEDFVDNTSGGDMVEDAEAIPSWKQHVTRGVALGDMDDDKLRELWEFSNNKVFEIDQKEKRITQGWLQIMAEEKGWIKHDDE
jgi:hypothetical protein